MRSQLILTMKKMKLIHKVCIWAMPIALMLAACSTDKDTDNGNNEVEVGADGLSFVLQEESFDSDVSTRSIPQPVDAGTIDLGNGIEAEVSIQRDGAEPTRANGVTRATPVSDGHYIIRVYDASGQLLSGQGKELSGEFKGGKFVHDAGKHLRLSPGTYKFVCTTDNVSLDNTFGKGSIVAKKWGSVITKEMIGVTEQAIVTGSERIIFMMYHRTSRLRVRFTGYTEQLTNVKAKFNFGSGSQSHFYIAVPTGFSGGGTAVFEWYSDEYSLPTTPTGKSETYVLANEFLTEYKYISNSKAIHGIYLDLSGTIYGKSVDIKDKPINFAQMVYWKDNGSYTINIKLNPTPALYLFNDGSCGALAEKGSRTPIGIVSQEKTNVKQGVAMGLRGKALEWEDSNSPTYFGHNYTTKYTEVEDALKDENGYNWTWDKSTDVDGLVKADEQTRYPAFYWASHDPYNVGLGKWYFPGIGEIIKVFDKLAKKTGVNGQTMTFEKKVDVITNAFTDAGGTDPLKPRSWSSTLYYQSGAFVAPIILYSDGDDHKIYVRPQGARKAYYGTVQTFPFVRF
jgi:hypothetical protein